MNLHAVADGVGYLGATLGVAMVVPQIVRTLRERATPGVSSLSWGLTALACIAWLLYGVRAAEIPQIPGNVLLISGAVLLVLVVPSTVALPVRVAGLAGPALALTVLAAAAPVAAIGTVAIATGIVSGLPQTVRSLRRRNRLASAVSVPSWALRVGSQASWLFYGLALRDLTVVVSATFILSNAVVVLAAEALRRPTRVEAVALA